MKLVVILVKVIKTLRGIIGFNDDDEQDGKPFHKLVGVEDLRENNEQEVK